MARVVYDTGEVIRARNTYKDADTGSLADPLGVAVNLREPDGTTTTYTYGTDAELTKVSVGLYQLLITLSQAGTYKWYWTATTPEGNSLDYDEVDSVRKF